MFLFFLTVIRNSISVLVGQNVLSKVLSFGFRPGRQKTGWTAAENDKGLEILGLRKKATKQKQMHSGCAAITLRMTVGW